MSVEFDVTLTNDDATVTQKHYIMCGCVTSKQLARTLAVDFNLLKDNGEPQDLTLVQVNHPLYGERFDPITMDNDTLIGDYLPIRYGVIAIYGV